MREYTTDRGFLTRKEYSDGNGTSYTHTAAGRLLTRAWARTDGTNPIVTHYTYDDGGRLTLTDYTDSTPDVSVTYDALGRQVTQSNGVATCTYSYDATTLVLDSETVAYDYNLDSTIDFTRVIDRSQDSLQRPSGFELKGSAGVPPASFTDTQATYAYTGNSNLVASVSGPVVTATNTYEADRNVLDTKSNSVTAGVVSSYDYTVNNLGQRTNVANGGSAFPTAPSWTWGFNAKGEVVKADHDSVLAYDRAFQFDGIGNRIEAVDGATTVTGTANYASNALNQYTTIQGSAGVSPAYDLDGNATAYPLPANASANSTLTWDAENRLISTTVSGTTTTYQYDAQSRRIAKTTASVTTTYVYDGWNPIAEYTNGTLTKAYTWGMDLSGSMQGAGGVGGLLSVQIGSAAYYPTYDGNGNVSEYIDSSGATTAHFEYDPFGRTVVDTDTAGLFSHRFSTKLLDTETGLYYYGYRYYDPSTGRWPSRDPIGERGGVNLYGFVGNDSISGFDLLGASPSSLQVGGIDDAREQMQNGFAAAAGRVSARGGQKAWYHKYVDDNIRALAVLAENFFPGGTGNGSNMFIYTCKYGWVDVGHFYTSAMYSGVLKNATGNTALATYGAYAGSVAVEFHQAIARQTGGTGAMWSILKSIDGGKGQRLQGGIHAGTTATSLDGWSSSAFTIEDLPSNYLGARFGATLPSAPGSSGILAWLVDRINGSGTSSVLASRDMIWNRFEGKMNALGQVDPNNDVGGGKTAGHYLRSDAEYYSSAASAQGPYRAGIHNFGRSPMKTRSHDCVCDKNNQPISR